MPAEPAVHPTPDTLAAFGLGKLDDALSGTIAEHLETCPDCRRLVSGMTADSFVRRLRGAGGSGRSTLNPAQSPTGDIGGPVAATVPPSGSVPPADGLPPGLADHPEYEIVRKLGEGGMGVVYLARHRLTKRDEVLKVMNKLADGRSDARDRFLREIETAATLSHPNVVKAHTALRVGDVLVLVMEFVPGEDLEKVVRGRGPLPVAHACYYAYQAAQGLQHAHERGMVHRDIKPSNLMLTRVGKKAVVKILDFGLAKARSEGGGDGSLSKPGTGFGTPGYMAPEQWKDAKGVDTRADVYSLGCTLYHLLAGRPPFEADTLFGLLLHHQQTTAEPLDRVRPDVPAELAAVVGRMMAKDPADRYPTPGEAAKALAPLFKPAAAGLPPDLPRAADTTVPQATRPGIEPPAETVPAAAQPRRPWLGVAVLVAGLAAAGLAGAWAGGVFKVTTPAGVLVVTVSEPGAEVFVDGEKVTVTGADGKPVEIAVKPGTRQVQVKRDGTVIHGEVVTIEGGERRRITAELRPAAVPQGEPDRDAAEALGNWSVKGDDELVQTEKPGVTLLLFGDAGWTDYDFEVDALKVEGKGFCSLVYRATDRVSFYAFNPSTPNKEHHLVRLPQLRGVTPVILKRERGQLAAEKWYQLKVRVRGKLAEAFVNGARVVYAADEKYPAGYVGLRTFSSSFRFKNIKVTAPDGKPLWEGPPDVEAAIPVDPPGGKKHPPPPPIRRPKPKPGRK